ncbi:MAG: hypothetical protein DWG80_06690, partial [Chloroflexi bacterium]|nr:hypothetical protein [Chloroflexota bacterium]
MNKSFPDFDLYEELEVSPRASSEVIDAAYRRLARSHHPDGRGESSSSKMVRLNVAYQVLSDAQKRGQYDGWLARKRASEGRFAGTKQAHGRSGSPGHSTSPRSSAPPRSAPPPPHTPSPSPGESPSVRRDWRGRSKGWAIVVGVVAAGILIGSYTDRDRGASPTLPRDQAGQSRITGVTTATPPVTQCETSSAPTLAPTRAPVERTQVPSGIPATSTPTAAAPSNPTPLVPTATAVRATSGLFGDGRFLVGRQIAPGTYQTTSALGNCTVGRDGSSMNLSAYVSGTVTIIVEPGWRDVSSTGCGTWQMVTPTLQGSFGNGRFLVGSQIAPGTYQTTSALGSCTVGRDGSSMNLSAYVGGSVT